MISAPSGPWATICRPALVMAALFAGCLDNRHTGGTVTTTGNTITATLVHPDGSPVAGARVTLLPVEYLPPQVPAQSRADVRRIAAVADSMGRIVLTAEAGSAYLLEGRGAASSMDSSKVWWNDLYLREDEDTTRLGPLTLERSGTLYGVVDQIPAATAKDIWVGFSGTDLFVRADETGAFILEGVPPGAHELVVLRDPRNEGGHFKVDGWRLAPGSSARLDTLLLQSPGATEARLSTRACVEDPVEIREYAYEGPSASPANHLLRSIMESNPPRWIEIDPCLATWRSRTVLPAEVFHFLSTTSSHDADFLALDDSGWTLKIDSTAALTEFFRAPTSLLNAQFYLGKVYALFKKDSTLKVYPGEAAYRENRPSEVLPLGRPTDSIFDLAISDSIVYFALLDSGRVRFSTFGLRSGTLSSPFDLAGFEGQWYSFTSAPGTDLWLLNDAGLLHLADPSARKVSRKMKVLTQHKLRALTRFHPLSGDS